MRECLGMEKENCRQEPAINLVIIERGCDFWEKKLIEEMVVVADVGECDLQLTGTRFGK